jgi:hypothetical protein
MGTAAFLFPSSWDVGPVGASYNVMMWHNCGPDENRLNDTLHATATAVDEIRILWVYADYAAPETTLAVRLRALGDSIEFFNGQTTTPTLEQLQPYDAVGAHTNYTFSSPDGMGDVLADYVDAGGGVVIGNFCFTTGWRMGGRIMTGNYATVVPGSNQYGSQQIGWMDPAHPIMAGVDSCRDYFMGDGPYAAGAESVATWADGRRYVGVSANQKVVGVNSYPGIYSANPPQRGGDWALVFHNALAFVTGSQTGVKGFDPLAPILHVELNAAPNPAQGRVSISYAVPKGGPVQIGIYDLTGRLVRTLVRGESASGVTRMTWDRNDDAGREVAAGVYVCKLTAGDKTQSRKLVVR